MVQPAGQVPMVMAAPMVAVAPMSRSPQALAPYHELFVRQTRRGCIQECLGCEQNNEFLISTGANPHQTIMYALEEASCCMRFFCKASRESSMTVIATGVKPPDDATFNQLKSTNTVMSYQRPFRCAKGPCKCCCYQEMSFFDDNNQLIGKITEDMWFCNPGFSITDNQGIKQYGIAMPSCCGGICVNCCAEGCCSCRIPFYIFGPEGYDYAHQLTGLSAPAKNKQGKDGKKFAQITKVWSGLGTELFTDADKFELEFPAAATPNHKAMLLGSLFFMNMNFFETQQGDQ